MGEFRAGRPGGVIAPGCELSGYVTGKEKFAAVARAIPWLREAIPAQTPSQQGLVRLWKSCVSRV